MSQVRPSQRLSLQTSPEQKLREVSTLYEKQFLREMVKAMRATVGEGGIIKPSHGERIFREQLDHEYVEQWGDRGGIGLADLIYEQLVERYGEKLGLKPPEIRPSGPIPLTTKSHYTLRSFTPPGKRDAVGFIVQRENSQGGAEPLVAPWSGEITRKVSMGLDEMVLEILHDNGMRSHLGFRGTTDRSIGEKLQAGDPIGILSPEQATYRWTVQAFSQEREI
ncbi:MAG: rod-binding protein [Bdellovibrionaceae bacterium]|nr:rod-binding protein [Pseudobdellovibrionaceae bacterium]